MYDNCELWVTFPICCQWQWFHSSRCSSSHRSYYKVHHTSGNCYANIKRYLFVCRFFFFLFSFHLFLTWQDVINVFWFRLGHWPRNWPIRKNDSFKGDFHYEMQMSFSTHKFFLRKSRDLVACSVKCSLVASWLVGCFFRKSG